MCRGSRGKIHQAFSLRFCILQAIKNWSWGRPGNEAILNSLLEKRVWFCSSFKALSTDTSFIKVGVCYQKLSTLECDFHYWLSSHCVQKNVAFVNGRAKQALSSEVHYYLERALAHAILALIASCGLLAKWLRVRVRAGAREYAMNTCLHWFGI